MPTDLRKRTSSKTVVTSAMGPQTDLLCRTKIVPFVDHLVGAQPEALAKGSLDFRHPLGFNRVGNETILMGGVMHLVELFRTGLSLVAPHNLWA
jgi:hypothetical protein